MEIINTYFDAVSQSPGNQYQETNVADPLKTLLPAPSSPYHDLHCMKENHHLDF